MEYTFEIVGNNEDIDSIVEWNNTDEFLVITINTKTKYRDWVKISGRENGKKYVGIYTPIIVNNSLEKMEVRFYPNSEYFELFSRIIRYGVEIVIRVPSNSHKVIWSKDGDTHF